jgi:RNA ligase (TIGR02306 family)
MERQLATIRRITEIKPIVGADAIELAIVDGWQSVVKKGEYRVGDRVVYLEVDSWVPHTLAPFLTKSGHYPKIYQGVEGQRLKTIKLKGELSQGLILPVTVAMELFDGSAFDDGEEFCEVFFEGANVTDILGILKWEKEIPAQLAGVMRGSFPTDIPKTDQERIQNLTKKLEMLSTQHAWEVTEKLDGSSCTFYLDKEGEFHVCSRNVNLKEVEGNAFWDIARKYDVENAMRNAGMQGCAIQGELVGPGIQGNQYQLTEVDFYAFDMYSAHNGTYCPSYYRVPIIERLGLKHSPVIEEEFYIGNDVQRLLEYADGQSELNGSKREGVVLKSVVDPSVSFKIISNEWLLKNDKE